MMRSGDLERYERLISRVLDGEASPQQRAELESAMRSDPRVRSLFETTAALDAQVGQALRDALASAAGGDAPVPRPAGSGRWRRRLGRLTGLAAAACVAWLLATSTKPPPDARLAEASWFVPPPGPADTLGEPAPLAGIPAVRVRDARSGWLVVPTRDPDEYLVIEVARVRETMVPIELDY